MRRLRVFILVVLALCIGSLPLIAQTAKLTKRQMKTLNKKLPEKVRNFLQSADTFEIWKDTVQEAPDVKPVYTPNRKYVVRKSVTRTKVLTAFYRDIATGGNGSACFYPNHSIIARKGRKSVTLTICYTCGEFVVSGSLGEWDAGISTRDPIASEELLNALLKKYGAAAKPVN
jgi:hypothetical protein